MVVKSDQAKAWAVVTVRENHKEEGGRKEKETNKKYRLTNTQPALVYVHSKWSYET